MRIVLILCCGILCASAARGDEQPDEPVTADPAREALQFVQSIQQGQAEQAWQRLTPELRQVLSVQALRGMGLVLRGRPVAGTPDITASVRIGLQTEEGSDGPGKPMLDLTLRWNGRWEIAGAELPTPPPAAAPPGRVVEQLIAALKTADEDALLALFAPQRHDEWLALRRKDPKQSAEDFRTASAVVRSQLEVAPLDVRRQIIEKDAALVQASLGRLAATVALLRGDDGWKVRHFGFEPLKKEAAASSQAPKKE